MKIWDWIIEFLGSTDTTTGQQIIADLIVIALATILGWLIVKFCKVIIVLYKSLFSNCVKIIIQIKKYAYSLKLLCIGVYGYRKYEEVVRMGLDGYPLNKQQQKKVIRTEKYYRQKKMFLPLALSTKDAKTNKEAIEKMASSIGNTWINNLNSNVKMNTDIIDSIRHLK